jgi:hypothetical protein
MSHRDHEDDYGDDFQPGRRRSSTNPLIIILVVLGAVGLVCILVCGAMMFMWTAPAPVNAPPAANQAAEIEPARSNHVYSRDEFKKLVMGKTPDEVIAALGRPDGTNDNPDGSPRRWHYIRRVTNPETALPDSAVLLFADGKVAGVEW